MEKRQTVLDKQGLFEGSGRIQTYMGNQIDPLNPDPKDVDIRDIAHSLALQCRFTGHTREFYSVAQHSVLVSTMVPERDRVWAILHDATEAYLADLARPIKLQPGFGEMYKEAEGRLMDAIADAFGIGREMPASVKEWDTHLLGAEMRDMMTGLDMPTKYTDRIVGWKPLEAEQMFLSKWNTYTGQRVQLPKERPVVLRQLKKAHGKD